MMKKILKNPERNEFIKKIFSNRSLMEKYGEEIESLNREMEIVFSKGEKRDVSYEEKYDEMKKSNPYGAAYLKRFIDIVEIDGESDFSEIERAYENFMAIGDDTKNPDVYASAVKLLEGNDLEDTVLWRDKYLDAVGKTCESFLTSGRSYIFLTDLLHEPRDDAPRFDKRFEDVYNKILETGREKNDFRILSIAYGLVDHVEKVKEGILNENLGSIELDEHVSTRFKKQNAYYELMTSLSNNIICYSSQRYWLRKNIGLEIPPYEDINDDSGDYGFGDLAVDPL